MQILIVEDDFLTAKFLQKSLALQGYGQPIIADNANDSLQKAKETKIDLAFMDINIKGPVDGLQLAYKLYSQYKVNIIFLTSYHDSQTIKEASYSNPLGFLIKPVNAPDVEATMMVAKQKIRATQSGNTDTIELGSYLFDKTTHSVSFQGENIALSKRESAALAALATHHGSSISSYALMEQIWGQNKSSSALRELISRLRKKLPKLQITRHSNIGYCLHA